MLNLKSAVFTIVQFLIVNNSFSQCVLNAVVVDKESNNAIANASVVIVNTKKGVATNNRGFFSIGTACHKKDSIEISAIGYTSLKICVDSAGKVDSFKLAIAKTILQNVTVKSTRQKLVANKFKNCSIDYFNPGDFTMQAAQSFYVPFTMARVKGIKLCKASGAASFKIIFYSFDTLNSEPLDVLVDTLFTYGNPKRKTTFDFTDLDLELKKGYYFIAIEWIPSKENRFIRKTKIENKKLFQNLLKPEICTSNTSESEELFVLVKQNTGKWISFDFLKRLLISVEMEEM
jgi:CarboxypepD_reg-like domain